MTPEEKGQDAKSRIFDTLLEEFHIGHLLREITLEAVQEVNALFKGRLIRRTGSSVDWLANKVLEIPNYKAIPIWLQLEEHEIKMINEAKGMGLES